MPKEQVIKGAQPAPVVAIDSGIGAEAAFSQWWDSLSEDERKQPFTAYWKTRGVKPEPVIASEEGFNFAQFLTDLHQSPYLSRKKLGKVENK